MLFSRFITPKPSTLVSHIERTRGIKTIAIVGNGDVPSDIARQVDTHDWVVRFNLASHCGRVGARTDTLVVFNHGLPGRRLRKGRTRINGEALKHCKELLFAVNPDDLPPPYCEGHAAKYGNSTKSLARKLAWDRPYLFIPRHFHAELIGELLDLGATTDVIPSTGVLGIKFFGSIHPCAELHLYGFNHSGWEGHSWDAERQWVDSLPNVIRH